MAVFWKKHRWKYVGKALRSAGKDLIQLFIAIKCLLQFALEGWHKWSSVIQPRLSKLLELVDLLIRAHENKTDLARLFRPAPWYWNKSLKEKKTQSDYSICQSKTSIVTNRLKRSRKSNLAFAMRCTSKQFCSTL